MNTQLGKDLNLLVQNISGITSALITKGVDLYKNASNWSSYSGIITSI